MAARHVYLVRGIEWTCSGYIEWTVAAYENEPQARDHVRRLRESLPEWQAACREGEEPLFAPELHVGNPRNSIGIVEPEWVVDKVPLVCHVDEYIESHGYRGERGES